MLRLLYPFRLGSLVRKYSESWVTTLLPQSLVCNFSDTYCPTFQQINKLSLFTTRNARERCKSMIA